MGFFIINFASTPFDRKIHTSKQVILSESPVFDCTVLLIIYAVAYTGILLTIRF